MGLAKRQIIPCGIFNIEYLRIPIMTSSIGNFFALLAICARNSPVTGEFPTQRPVTGSFDVFFDRAWINDWVNNGEAGDLRRYRVHYDVTVMRMMNAWIE